MSFLLNFTHKNSFVVPRLMNVLPYSLRVRSFASRTRISELKSVERKCGLPGRPSRPGNAYIQFTKDMRRTQEDFANRPQTDINVEIAGLWRAEDDAKKSIYKQKYKQQMAIYRKELADYKNKFTAEQLAQVKRDLRLLQENKKIVRVEKERKILATELGKPKHPASIFALYGSELREHSSGKLSMSDVCASWRALSESERKMYSERYRASMQTFKTDLEKWKERLRKAGYVDQWQI